MQNIVFIASSPEIRTSLYNLGLDFLSVKVNSQSYYMVITKQLRLMQELALKNNINTLYTSDSRRKTYRLVQCGDTFLPTELGTLKRSMSSEVSPLTGGNFCLIVTEDNRTYNYYCDA